MGYRIYADDENRFEVLRCMLLFDNIQRAILIRVLIVLERTLLVLQLQFLDRHLYMGAWNRHEREYYWHFF